MSSQLRIGDVLKKNGKVYTKNGEEKSGKNYVSKCQLDFYIKMGFLERI